MEGKWRIHASVNSTIISSDNGLLSVGAMSLFKPMLAYFELEP